MSECELDDLRQASDPIRGGTDSRVVIPEGMERVDVVRDYARHLRDALDSQTRFSHHIKGRVCREGALVEITIHPRSLPLDVDVMESPVDEEKIHRKLKLFENGFGLDTVSFGGHGDVYHIAKPFHPRGIDPLELWSQARAVEDAREIRDAPDHSENWRPSKQDIASDRHDWDGGIAAGARVNAYSEAKALVASAAHGAELDSGGRAMRQHFRGIVMPRQLTTIGGCPPILGTDGKPIYRYMVAGLLCTDRPIQAFQTKTKNRFRAEGEFCLDGDSGSLGGAGLVEHLAAIRRVPGPKVRFGPIGRELTNLGDWPEEYETVTGCWHCNADVDTYDEFCMACGEAL